MLTKNDFLVHRKSCLTVHVRPDQGRRGDTDLACCKLNIEPSHEKTNNLHMRKPKTQISNCTADQRLCFFATRIVLFLFYLYPKFQASSFMLSLYSLVCVRPGRKPKLLVFSCTGSIKIDKVVTMLYTVCTIQQIEFVISLS